MAYRIPLNRPCLAGHELQYVAEAIRAGHSSGDGTFTRRCHRFLEEHLSAPRVLLTTSCTHALEMSALLLDVRAGHEVILPSFTFVSTANAFVLRGARPVFADIRPDTLNIDEAALESLITPRTRAAVVVHYAGIGCDMEHIMHVLQHHRIPLVEDNAHGLFAKYAGRYLGTFGCLATLSFHETKNVICGEGGALIINDPTFVDRAEIIREKGTNRSRFFRGQVDKYTWVDVGSSYLPSDLLAAFLFAQLERHREIHRARKRIWFRYAEALADWARRFDVRLPVVPHQCDQSYHMFYLILPTPALRDSFIQHLKREGILAAFHYVPLHLSQMGQELGGRPGQCPVAECVSARLVRLPFYNDLSDQDQDIVIQAVTRFGGHA